MGVLGGLLLLVLVGRPGAAQSGIQLNDQALNLVVQLMASGPDGGEPEIGAGILITATNRIVIVTAAHVVRGAEGGGTVRAVFRFARKDTVGLVIDRFDPELDLAVLSVERQAVRYTGFAFDRQGDPGRLAPGDALYAVGCPDGACWEAGVTPDRFISVRPRELVFESFFLSPGNSGGPLFNRLGEIVAMVTEKADPLGHAIPIATVAARLRSYGYHPGLRRRAIPREGYSTRFGLTGLAPTAGQLYQDGRLPSGRVSLALRGTRTLGWHVAAMRLAPENLLVSGGMAGVDLRLQAGRLALTPFAEVGFARIEGRMDIGGITVQGANGPTYLPIWRQLKDDVIGTGAGATVEVQLLPHVALEGLAAYWSFTPPAGADPLPDIFAGAGLRFGF